jgi:hypothetical protein
LDKFYGVEPDMAIFGKARGYSSIELPVEIHARQGQSKFGGNLKANFKILRALILSMLFSRYAAKK